MPVIAYTVGELFAAGVDTARKLSDEILKLSDLEQTPYAPGEGPDTRRHKIAKLGKQLAEAFKAVDDFMAGMAEVHAATHGPPQPQPTNKPDDTGAN